MKTDHLIPEVSIMSFESFLTWYLDCNRDCRRRDSLPSLEALKKDYIEYLLEITCNDIQAVADILRLPPERLTRRLKKYNFWL